MHWVTHFQDVTLQVLYFTSREQHGAAPGPQCTMPIAGYYFKMNSSEGVSECVPMDALQESTYFYNLCFLPTNVIRGDVDYHFYRRSSYPQLSIQV